MLSQLCPNQRLQLCSPSLPVTPQHHACLMWSITKPTVLLCLLTEWLLGVSIQDSISEWYQNRGQHRQPAQRGCADMKSDDTAVYSSVARRHVEVPSSFCRLNATLHDLAKEVCRLQAVTCGCKAAGNSMTSVCMLALTSHEQHPPANAAVTGTDAWVTLKLPVSAHSM